MKQLKNMVRRLKWLIRSAQGKDLYYKPQVRVDVESMGGAPETGYGAWPVCAHMLDKDSVVYAVGIGEDISFDLALIDRFQLTVHAFDPTPASLAWLEKQDLPASFVSYPLGLAGYDGTAEFHAPANPAHVSFSMSHQAGNLEKSVVVDVKRLSSLMAMLGHSHIDVLKMDIEGGEYDVIADLVTTEIDVKQLLVEFHHRIPGIGLDHTRKAVSQLNEAGYKIAYVSAIGEEYLFVKK